MGDKELLELAAKAAGMKIHHWSTILPGPMMVDPATDDCGGYWNPLEEDGDAFRLAVKLNIQLAPDEWNAMVSAFVVGKECDPIEHTICVELWSDGGNAAATRRAIVRAAVATGTTHD